MKFINIISSTLIFIAFCLVSVSMAINGFFITALDANTVILLIDSLAKLLEYTAWPIAILIALLMYKTVFVSVIKQLASRLTKAGKDGLEFGESSQKSTKKNTIDNQQTLEDALRDQPLIDYYQKKIRNELEEGAEKSQLSLENFLLGKTAELYIVWHFERVYRTIFGSQIKVLQHLNSYGLSANVQDIFGYYETAATNAPFVYDNYTFEQWLHYLQLQSLIIIEHDVVSISQEGQGLLSYIFNHGYDLNKPF